MKKYWPWILLLTLLIPIVQIVVFTLRFGLPSGSMILESLVFAPVCLL
jgi:hypothetical protein